MESMGVISLAGLHADEPLLVHVELLLLRHRAVVGEGVYEDGLAVAAIELAFFLKVGEVLADSN